MKNFLRLRKQGFTLCTDVFQGMKELVINTQGAHHLHSGMLNTETAFEMTLQLWGLQLQPNNMPSLQILRIQNSIDASKQQNELKFFKRIKLPFSKHKQT